MTEALSRGHQVTAVVRSETRYVEFPNEAQQRQGDASRIEDVIGQDLVIAGLAHTQVRLLAIGGAGSLNVADKEDTLVVDDTRYVSPAWRDIAVACVDQYNVYKANSGTHWTYLSPPAMLLMGERTSKFRLGKDELLVDQQANQRYLMKA